MLFIIISLFIFMVLVGWIPRPWSTTQESHMQWGRLEMRSQSKLTPFLSGPLPRDLDSLPGCGHASKTAMAQRDIYTLDQLCGRFMLFDRDTALMVQWLEKNGWAPGYAETAVKALAMKLHNLLDK